MNASLDDLPDIALSIQNPWGFLIANGLKTIENRDWKPWNPGLKFRGPVAIHAGLRLDAGAMGDLLEYRHPVTGEPFNEVTSDDLVRLKDGAFNGGIVGVAEVVDVVTMSDDEWFVGPYGLVLANARPIPFIRARGALGFFKWKERVW